MMDVIWVTDPHLNFVSPKSRQAFYNKMKVSSGDLVVISGDIAESETIALYLGEMAEAIQPKLIYFVLGNHDYYKGTVAQVRSIAIQLHEKHSNLNYLSSISPVAMPNGAFLVGQDGWADGRSGDYMNSTMDINDSTYIQDLYDASLVGKDSEEKKNSLLLKMQALADKDALSLKSQIQQAVDLGARSIHIITHVPPYPESCLGEDVAAYGASSVYPYFVSKVMGDTLTQCAERWPDITFSVFCGHTHDASTYQPLKNLTVYCAGAQYGMPLIVDKNTLNANKPYGSNPFFSPHNFERSTSSTSTSSSLSIS